jgi:hypothetical protein
MTAAVVAPVVLAVEVSAPQVEEIAVRREEAPAVRINYFFHPGVRSPSYRAQRQAANGLLNDQITQCLEAAKRPRVRAPKHEPTMDLFDKKVSQRVRVMAVAMPMVLASLAGDCLVVPGGAGVPLEREFARRALWRSLRLVCRAFNEMILVNKNMLWQAWFDALPAFYRARGDVRFVLRCSHERAFTFVVCMMQRYWNRKNTKQWLTETLATFECYRACRRVLESRSPNAGAEFLYTQVCAQLEERGLYVEVPHADAWPWNELPRDTRD